MQMTQYTLEFEKSRTRDAKDKAPRKRRHGVRGAILGAVGTVAGGVMGYKAKKGLEGKEFKGVKAGNLGGKLGSAAAIYGGAKLGGALGKKVGETFSFNSPAGTMTYKIISIE